MKRRNMISTALLCICIFFGASLTARAEEQIGSVNAGHFLNIGSVSKMYVVTAIMQLVDQGKITLDAPVTDYIPDFTMADERYRDITVRMLMNHTSGLMGTIYGDIFRFDERSADYHDRFLKLLRSQRLKADPGAYNCYCNDGFTLLEILTERVSGISFTEYLQKYITEPLGVENTGTLWSMTDLTRQIPYYFNGGIKIPTECPQMIGAGGIMSNARDVCVFGSAFFDNNGVLLSEKAKEEIRKNNAVDFFAESFGLGWDQVERSDYEAANITILSKGGDTFFQNAAMIVAPKAKISIAVLGSGGSSSVDEEIALALMDIALSEQDIFIDHPESEIPETVNQIPGEFLSYEGLYASANMVLRITFPEKQYMLVYSLTNTSDFEEQYQYASNGTFVKMSGDVESGNAIIEKPLETLYFKTINGRIYVCENENSPVLEKIEENKISDGVQAAWEERCESKFFYCNGVYSDTNYLTDSKCVTLCANQEAKGYVNGYTIVDETHAENRIAIPGSASRDVTDVEIHRTDGREYLTLVDRNMVYLSGKDIPEFTEDITQVPLKTGEAVWYRLDGSQDVTLTFDIPEHAAVYVYDQYGNVKFCSLMPAYGDSVPLPGNENDYRNGLRTPRDYGMIVFIGETGSTIGISR